MTTAQVTARVPATSSVPLWKARPRDEVDLDALTAGLHTAVADTTQPAHVSLWTRERVP